MPYSNLGSVIHLVHCSYVDLHFYLAEMFPSVRSLSHLLVEELELEMLGTAPDT